jgi:hypothetical protein
MTDTVKRVFTITIDEFEACSQAIDVDDIKRALWASSTFRDVDKIEVIERKFHWRKRETAESLSRRSENP